MCTLFTFLSVNRMIESLLHLNIINLDESVGHPYYYVYTAASTNTNFNINIR